MERRFIRVCGVVQGVGFRPFVFALARRHGLCGFVRNRGGQVEIEAEGGAAALDLFVAELTARPPPMAQIERVESERRAPCGEREFCIAESAGGAPEAVFVVPDVATCADCRRELFDPADRRYGYPFLNCTNCGPRLTIVTGAPYDRARTTMAGFPMCAPCRAEYDDPSNRRYHAQPTACPACGPRLLLLGPDGRARETVEPLAEFARALLTGAIGAVKGVGGYHLACDARNPGVIAALRQRKGRDEKPFAVMVPDLAAAERECEIGPAERELLASPEAPIVLLRRRTGSQTAENAAPGNPVLGVMLPYSPLHLMLMRAAGGVPLVMTSGNRTDEPIVYGDDAPERLAGIADLFLTHDRPIRVRCDDSVTRVIDGTALLLRRSRGFAPRPVALPFECPRPGLAVGGQLKATFALARGRHAFPSHHLGDLDHLDAYRAFERDLGLYENLVGIAPEWIACDLHPDYATTRYAEDRARRAGVPLVRVQHHHAHMASCMAEHGLTGQALGVIFDGTGYGPDGSVWGGEFLVGDCRSVRRAAHLRRVALPGGEAAVREPWRMAAAHLADAGTGFGPLEPRHRPRELALVHKVLTLRPVSPLTSSAGRLFDAVAALAGVRDRIGFEGQAAIELEALAAGEPPDTGYPFAIDTVRDAATGEMVHSVDTRPLIRAVAAEVAAGVAAARVARRFHSALVEIVVRCCTRLRAETGLSVVVLSGGVFANAVLTREVMARLTGEGFRAYRHRLVPPNDGGLSLGQVAVAAAAGAL